MILRVLFGVSISLAVVVGCSGGSDGGTVSSSSSGSGGGGGGGASGVTPTKTLDQLTDEEKRSLCDWSNQVQGGYGTQFKCDGGVTVTNKKDQQACIDAYAPCKNATVSDFEACSNLIASTDRCDVFAALGDPKCAWVTKCEK